MLEFDTILIPPTISQENINSEWTVETVVNTVLGNELDAKRMIRTHIPDYKHILVAFKVKEIYGFQVLDYDHHEVAINLGAQALSSALRSEEQSFLSERLKNEARNRYEDF